MPTRKTHVHLAKDHTVKAVAHNIDANSSRNCRCVEQFISEDSFRIDGNVK